jgi:hypothetical protein
MLSSFYDKSFETIDVEDYKWSPAEVNQILFRNFENSETAVKELRELTSKDLYGFDLVERPADYQTFMNDKPSQDE